jgi:predicted RNA-binding Zn ribbon-like protein
MIKTGESHDLLPALIADRRGYRRTFGLTAPRSAREREEIVGLRADLRSWLAGPVDESALNDWLKRVPLQPRILEGQIAHRPLERHLVGIVLACVVDAIADGVWPRLKACDECQYVFFDHTRNGSRRWCMMARGADPNGRSCGAIAKVRRYRGRQRAARRDEVST